MRFEPVDCIDPYDLYSTFEPLLSERLPLRNLHWKSTNRPLRSIETLYVDLVAISDGGSQRPSASERRHQIPGLHQTPYLKIFLLRCDDNDTYKATCRKQIKDWIKANDFHQESRKRSNNQENHDACEWLIVHLVHADTPVANQIRTTREAQLGTTDSTDSLSNKSRFLVKGPATVVEKLRADFNSPKSAIDRIAQVRIPNPDQHLSAEYNDQLQDLVEKLELTILASFDLRVQQYEEDIRERESRRGFPGWNFNTFFILKEGLARGFENVGLFDDALAGYDELALGLETVVQEQSQDEAAGKGGRLPSVSDELKGKIHACLKDANDATGPSDSYTIDESMDPAHRLQRKDFPLDAGKSPFRELILANEISIFDFRLYVFACQLSLLLRKANASSLFDETSETFPKRPSCKKHFLPLAELCTRAKEFLAGAARTLRYDLQLALEVETLESAEETEFRLAVISNFVHSWVYVGALQILEQTDSPELFLPALEDDDLEQNKLPRPPKKRIGGSQHSSASFSITPGTVGINGPGDEVSTRQGARTGAEELAGARADLYLLAKQVVERIGRARGWLAPRSAAGSAITSTNHKRRGHGDVASKETDATILHGQSIALINGIQYHDLRSVFNSCDAFTALFSCLATLSYRCYLAGNRTKSAERSLGELAILKFEQADYTTAASYLSRKRSCSEETEWTVLRGEYLDLYAKCLRNLGRYGEYVTSLLQILKQKAADRSSDDREAVEGYLAQLWEFSEKLTTRLYAKLDEFFSITNLKPHICHFEDRDGFYLRFMVAFHLGSLCLPEGLEITLSTHSESKMPSVTLLVDPVELPAHPIRVDAKSNVNLQGWYTLESIRVKMGNIIFHQDYQSVRSASAIKSRSKADEPSASRVFIYPAQQSLQLTAVPAPYINLSQMRAIAIELRTGWNDVNECFLSLRPASSGLRLHLHESRLEPNDDSHRMSSMETRDGVQFLKLSNCVNNSCYTLLVPYSVDNIEAGSISAWTYLDYLTNKGRFTYSGILTVNTMLPIRVDVQDVFQQEVMISRFTVSPATVVPLRVYSDAFSEVNGCLQIESYPGVQNFMDIFLNQSASFLYRFSTSQAITDDGSQQHHPTLSVRYACLDEVVTKALSRHFMEFLSRSPVSSLLRPLMEHLRTTVQSRWSAQDFEAMGLCREIQVCTYEDVQWDDVLVGFELESRRLARTWLRKWHEAVANLNLDHDHDSINKELSREIVVPVDIPAPSLVVTISIDLQQTRPRIAMLDEAITAKLRLHCSQLWSARRTRTSNGSEPDIDISFEVSATSDSWVIGGMKKGHFLVNAATASNTSEHSASIILIPQHTGRLLLPPVDVKCQKMSAPRSSDSGWATTNKYNHSHHHFDNDTVSFEVDNASLAKSVYVVTGSKENVVDVSVDVDVYGHADSGSGSASGRGSGLVDSITRDRGDYQHVR